MAQVWAGRKLVPPHLRGKRARARVERIQRDAQAANDLRTWRRASAVLRCLDGANTVEITAALGVTNSAVSKWLSAYVARGFEGIKLRSAPGPQSRLTDAQLTQLASAIERGPEAAGFATGVWTGRLVAEFVQREFGVAYNWKYIPELLHRLGFSVQRPRKRLSRADREAQAFWLRETFPQIKKTPSTAAE